MALQISPRDTFSMVNGEEIAFALNTNNELGANTISSVAYTITDGSGEDKTSAMSGGSSDLAGIITFGVIAESSGVFNLLFIVTCNEYLPDGITKNEFFVTLTLTVTD